MCGITGWFSSAPIPQASVRTLQRMNRAIAHRGPDGNGTYLYDHAALGHTRLAIIDLDGGTQPMHSHDQRFCIVFNGEIYNYRELRSELIGRGHKFLNHSDTEVIIELYRAEGWHGFTRLRGMYAFALWDQQNSTGLLVRDPLGIKPLFIRCHADGLVFGSEAKAILAHHNSPGSLDPNSLHLLMNFRYLPGNRSLFQGIEQLNPGDVLVWDRHHKQVRHKLTNDTYPRQSILDALHESVRLHLTSDVEVASYLSGGIDSATITTLAKQYTPSPLRTFTLNVGDDPLEATNAARSAELMGVINIQGEVNADLQDQLPRLLWHLEVPKINALQAAQLAQLTSKHVKVALSGLGGDELFLGYNAHKIMHLANAAHNLMPSWLSHPLGNAGAGIIAASSRLPWSENERALRMLGKLGSWPQVYGLLRNLWDNPKARQQIYGPRLLDQQLENAFDTVEELWPAQPHPVAAMAEYEWKQKMVNDLLWQEDRVSMAVGLEVRVPFVDKPFSRQVQTMDHGTLMPQGRLKYYMREMVSSLLPREILNRPKSGFQVDAASFFNTQLKPLADKLLSKDKIHEFALFNPDFVECIRSYPSGKKVRWHYFMLYLMLMSHLWIEQFEQHPCSID